MPGPKNTNKDKIHLNSFIGGKSVDFKYGVANSFYDSQALDFRTKPSQMSVLPGMTNLSTKPDDLITAMVQDPSGNRWAVGAAGSLYKIDTSNVLSKFGYLNSNGAAGIAYNQQSDQLYIPAQHTVSLYGQLQGSPTFRLGNFGPSASTANGTVNLYDPDTNAYDIPRNNAASVAGGITLSNYATQVTNDLTGTYSIPSTISEASINFCAFVPDIEPFYSVAVFVTSVGTGDWTLTMHDSLNNNIGAETITHANMIIGWNNFVFSSQVRAIPNAFATGAPAGYHFHLTSSVSSDTAKVATVNADSLEGCNFLLFAYRLLQTQNGWHPTTIFGQYLCIGNGPYLSTYNFANDSSPNNGQWIRHQLTLDFGYEVCGLSVNNQWLVIAAEKRSNNTNRSYQDGYLYFWDGTNTNFNFKIEIPMGAPYSVYTLNNITYFYCAGSLFAWGGGQQVLKVRYLAYQNTDYLGTTDSTIINPNMMDVRYNLLMLGYPSTTTNTAVNYGIYSWGSVELTFPNSFCYSYALSNGIQNYSTQNNLKIGMIKNFVDTMYTSWQYMDSNNQIHYGLDILSPSSTPASTFNWQSLIWDGGARYKTKKALRYKISFEALPAGTTITAYYIKDRGATISADPATGTPYTATAGATNLVVEMNNLRFHELQWGFTGTCSSSATSPPTITGVTMEIDPLEDETDVRSDG